METLAEKVVRLKSDGIAAVRVADFWQKQIAKYGEHKAQEFYLSLGHNHIERKGYDYEGLTLSREPKEHEKVVVKGIAQAQQSAKESIGKILLALRTDLISDGLKGIEDLTPATYHTLVLETPAQSRSDLRDRLIKVYRQGRRLVANELMFSKRSTDPSGPTWSGPCFPMREDEGKADEDGEDEEEFDDLDTLTDLTDSRVANEIQSRITGAAARFALLGLAGAALLSAIQQELADGSVSYIDRASTGLANKVINIGRGDEARARNDDWGRVEYSALLDQNVCGPCAAEDGQEAATEDELTPVPNPECEGGDWCRCFHVFIAEGNM